MLFKILTYSKYGNLYCGVEHSYLNGQEKLNVLLLKKKNGEFFVEKTFESDTIIQLKGQLKKQQHLFLIINTNQVLSKILEGAYEPQKTLGKAFPNLNIEDFYYEIHATSENTFISICRKNYIDNILQEYNANHLNVIGFSLGNLIGSQLKSYLNNRSINSTNASISFGNNGISGIKKSENIVVSNITINDLEVTNVQVLPLAGIIAYYTNQKTNTSNFNQLCSVLSDNFKHIRIFGIGLKFGLSLTFTLLLISFLFFSHFSSKINNMKSELELNKAEKKSMVRLANDVSKKERLVTDFSMTSSKSSWYLDQIGGSIPTSIILSELQYQPLEKNIKKDNEILLKENKIIIKGSANNTTDFSQWIKALEQQDWIDKVTIQQYGIGKKVNTEFELLIIIDK